MSDRFKLFVLLAQALSTLFMTGVIWFVQVVHYPLFARVGAEYFPAYEAEHMRRTTGIVGPAMLVEALTGVLLVWRRPNGVPARTCWLALGLLLLCLVVDSFPAGALSRGPRGAIQLGRW